MSQQMFLRTWYRSLYQGPEGELEVWCESRDPEEIQRVSQGKDCVFQKMEFYEITNGWEGWDPNGGSDD